MLPIQMVSGRHTFNHNLVGLIQPAEFLFQYLPSIICCMSRYCPPAYWLLSKHIGLVWALMFLFQKQNGAQILQQSSTRARKPSNTCQMKFASVAFSVSLCFSSTSFLRPSPVTKNANFAVLFFDILRQAIHSWPTLFIVAKMAQCPHTYARKPMTHALSFVCVWSRYAIAAGVFAQALPLLRILACADA